MFLLCHRNACVLIIIHARRGSTLESCFLLYCARIRCMSRSWTKVIRRKRLNYTFSLLLQWKRVDRDLKTVEWVDLITTHSEDFSIFLTDAPPPLFRKLFLPFFPRILSKISIFSPETPPPEVFILQTNLPDESRREFSEDRWICRLQTQEAMNTIWKGHVWFVHTISNWYLYHGFLFIQESDPVLSPTLRQIIFDVIWL